LEELLFENTAKLIKGIYLEVFEAIENGFMRRVDV